jgi:hypothetical protein
MSASVVVGTRRRRQHVAVLAAAGAVVGSAVLGVAAAGVGLWLLVARAVLGPVAGAVTVVSLIEERSVR